jgi:hypothetical protein
MAHRAQLPRPVLAVVIGLPMLLAAGVVIVAVLLGRPDDQQPPETADWPLAVPAVPAPAAGSAHCRALLDGLPDRLASAGTELHRRPLATPAPAATAAWGAEQPVILRCGLDRPAELTRTAALLEINGVRWLRLAGPDATNTWVAVDRPVYVALTMSDAAGTGPLQDVSTAITATLPAQPVQPAG